jgi:hypothetical protein
MITPPVTYTPFIGYADDKNWRGPMTTVSSDAAAYTSGATSLENGKSVDVSLGGTSNTLYIYDN